MEKQTVAATIVKVTDATSLAATDLLTVEEPLEIRVIYHLKGIATEKKIAVTMRTPGNDQELAAGFLFTEGIIGQATDIAAIHENGNNVVTVTLTENAVPHLQHADRNFYTTSSCGVCGKASIDAIKASCNMDMNGYPYDSLRIQPGVLAALPDSLRASQSVFMQTGGIHGCALFAADGSLLQSREDVGRHNALDKLIGYHFLQHALPLPDSILLLSGRASFELVQKAAMAGIKAVAAVGAPSSLAVQMAEEWNMTLVGFLRGERFNVYSGAQRIVI